jgi:NADPH:quinone reductase-like Zn-dependent oxidoreductase
MAAPPPATMAAVVYDPAGPLGMRLAPAHPVPSPGPKQLLIRVHAAGINPVDYKLPSIMGRLIRGKGVGLDFSGVVERAGDAAGGGFARGDRVFGNCSGSLAEFAVADASACAKLPDALSHADAAALPTVALTGMQSLLDHGFKAGDRVLIPGASGGTGSVGVQLAKRCLGASHVTGVCSGANAGWVRELGADVAADYTAGAEALEAALRRVTAEGGPYDICYDTVTSPEDTDYEPLARKLLKPGGKHVAINGGGLDWVRTFLSGATGCNWQRRDYALVMKRTDGAQLAQCAAWAAEGKLRARVEATFALDAQGVQAAFEKLKGRRTRGKLVITVA